MYSLNNSIIYFIDISDKLIKRQVSALEEFNKFSSEMALFRTWLEKAYKILEDKERQLANLNKVQAGIEDFKAFVSDVMTHGADLKFLTISGQKFVDLSKVGVTHSLHHIVLLLSVELFIAICCLWSTYPLRTMPMKLLGIYYLFV